MLRYANRVAQTGFLGDHIKQALYTLKQQEIVKSLSEKLESGGYHQDTLQDGCWLATHPLPEIPQILQGDYAVQSARTQVLERGQVGTLMPGMFSPDEPKDNERIEYLGRLREWADTVGQEARQRYRKEQQDALKAAKLETGNKAIDSFDFESLWGQGSAFILQFTAVVTIIFAVIALSVLNRLGTDQAGTILAAIAGYVLGQATSRGPRSGTAVPARPSPEQGGGAEGEGPTSPELSTSGTRRAA
jgi:hypothetical protein